MQLIFVFLQLFLLQLICAMPLELTKKELFKRQGQLNTIKVHRSLGNRWDVTQSVQTNLDRTKRLSHAISAYKNLEVKYGNRSELFSLIKHKLENRKHNFATRQLEPGGDDSSDFLISWTGQEENCVINDSQFPDNIGLGISTVINNADLNLADNYYQTPDVTTGSISMRYTIIIGANASGESDAILDALSELAAIMIEKYQSGRGFASWFGDVYYQGQELFTWIMTPYYQGQLVEDDLPDYNPDCG